MTTTLTAPPTTRAQRLRELTQGLFTTEEVDTFTNHDCFWLAGELHDLGYGRIAYVYQGMDRVDGDELEEIWTHMSIELEPGVYFDATGVRTAEELLAEYDGSEIRLVRDDDHYGALTVGQELWYDDTCDYSLTVRKCIFVLDRAGY